MCQGGEDRYNGVLVYIGFLFLCCRYTGVESLCFCMQGIDTLGVS